MLGILTYTNTMTIDEQIAALQAAKREQEEVETKRMNALVEEYMTVSFAIMDDKDMRADILHPDIGYFRIWRHLDENAPVEVAECVRKLNNNYTGAGAGGMIYAFSISMKKVLGSVGGGYVMLKPCEQLWYKHDRADNSWITCGPRMWWNDRADELVYKFFATL